MYVTIKDYSLFQSVYSVKADLIKKNGNLEDKSFYLKYKTHILEDNKTLYEYKIKKEDKLEVILKNKGGTMAKGLAIFIWSLIFVIYFTFLVLGFMPFVAFIIPNIIVKGLSKLVNFCYNLTHPNNFMNSVFYFLKKFAIPFMDFIFGYFGLFIFVYLLTFFSTYHLYYYAKKEDVCAANNVTKVVSLLTGLLTVIFYFLANSASFMKFWASLVPEIMRKPFQNAANKISNLRLKIPTIFNFQLSMVESLVSMFKGIGYLKLFGTQLLDNWDIAMELIKTDDARKAIQEQGVDDIINYIRIIEKAESHYANGKTITNQNKKNAEGMKQIFPCSQPSASGYFLRSLFFNFIKMIIDMTFFIDICNVNGDAEKVQEEMKEDFARMIEKEQRVGKLSDENRIKADENRQKEIEKFVEKIQNIKLESIINIDCLINTIINGVTFSSFYTFLFLIIFIIFFFVKL